MGLVSNTTAKSAAEPIAVIGIGCRFPGAADSPQAFWELMAAGRDGIVEVPNDRWDSKRFYDPDPSAPGKMYVKHGGFLQQRIDTFDALAFGVAPREAMAMDPQQRLLLEVTWEALEDAGLDIDALAGSATGVFVGAFMVDNMLTQLNPMNRALIGPQTAVSWTMSILSNRLSYLFDLRGPSLTLDTACSSSLVATHLGCQSLWRGECSLVLVGGVNVMHRPEVSISMCKGQFLAPDGRCKSFDARGDGYGRGEGAGVVVLKPLHQAVRDGDLIYGLICGTGSNQDGRTNGITVPNPDAQAELIERVCAEVGIEPKQIRYFEAHGTGTEVGDPLEASALGAVVGKDRSPGDACLVGSVKANIGHLEAASGVAGLIKTLLCLEHRQIPPIANLQIANPAIPFAELGLRLPRSVELLPVGEGPAYAAVNSFGYGGTNAHVILCEAPAAAPAAGEAESADTALLLPLSARSEQALVGLAHRYVELLSAPAAPPLADLCYSAGARRAHHGFRHAVVGSSRATLLEKLSAFAASGKAGKTQAGREAEPVFVFTGMGPQWWAMGRELLREEPAFRKHAEACDVIFRRLSGWSILAELTAAEAVSRITETQIAQPANFVIQSSLVALLRSWGIEPAAVVGHSVGEVTAAYVAGVLDLEDAVRVSFQRSRIQKKAAGLGAMLAAGLTLEQANALTHEVPGVAVAAANSPTSVTLAGETGALEQIAARLKRDGIFNRFLQVEVAYHSAYMDPLLPELRECLQGLRCRAPQLPLYSTVTGAAVREPSYDAEYWCANVRQSVLFAKATAAVLEDGYRLFLEVGPHPVLSSSIKECIAQLGVRAQSIATLRREKPERATLLEGIGALYTAGCRIDWRKLHAGRRYVRLPRYPWQREIYWQESADALQDRLGDRDAPALLAVPVSAPRPCWESAINAQRLPYLADHRVDGLVVLPGAAYVEAALALHSKLYGQQALVLEDLRFRKALVVAADDEPVLRVECDERSLEFTITSRPRSPQGQWSQHAAGRLSLGHVTPAARVDLEALRAAGERVDAADHYQRMQRRGLEYGPWFQGIRQLWRGTNEVLALIEGSEALSTERAHLHPTLLDACLQSLLALLDSDGAEQHMYLPVAIRQLRLHASPGARLYSHGRLTRRAADSIEGDLQLCDLEGNVLVEVLGLRCQAVAAKRTQARAELDQWLYQYRWQPTAFERSAGGGGRWLVFMDEAGLGGDLAAQLTAQGVTEVHGVQPGPSFERRGGEFRIAADSRRDLQRLLRTVGECQGVVYLWGLDELPRDPAGIARSEPALLLIQALAQLQPRATRLYVVTRGVEQVSMLDACAGLQQAPLVGLARVAASEHPELRCTHIDLDPQPEPWAANAVMLAQELLSDSVEDAVALRQGERFSQRLLRVSPKELQPVEQVATLAAAEPFALSVGAEGELQWRRSMQRQCAAHEVEIRAQSLGLRRQDGRRAAGQAGGQRKLHDSVFHDEVREIIGVVTRVGAEVPDYRPGQRLLAIVPGAIGSHFTVAADTLLAVPLLDEAIGTGVLALLAAHHGLRDLARLESGETLLILGALDNPGVLSLARAQGARVLVASTSEAERTALPGLDGELLLDASAADFMDQVRAASGARGVDVVLNLRSTFGNEWQLLSAGGRWIQLGAVDADTALPFSASAAFGRGLSFTSVDIERMVLERPQQVRKLLAELRAQQMLPPVTRCFAASQVTQALQQLTAGVGPVALELTEPGLAVLPPALDTPLLAADATYLITGGCGGFGLETAKWLAAHGARHLVLVGRTGAATPRAQTMIAALEAQGTQVRVIAADIGSEAAVVDLLQDVAASMPPLKGILHTAGVLDDGSLLQLTGERQRAVMRPKALGAWYLHQYTQNVELDFFVLFSSISALIGNANQGNYVAANLFLDALACRRRALGLAATSVHWGVLGEVGMAANHGVQEHLQRMGMRAFSAAQAMQALEHILAWQPTQLGVMDVDWSSWARSNAVVARLPRFALLIAEQAQAPHEAASMQLRRHLQALAPEAAGEHFAQLFAEQVAATLRLPPAKVDLQLSLTRIGGDSLMALELQGRLRECFGTEVSTLELLQDKDLAQLARQMLLQLRAAQPSAATEAAPPREALAVTASAPVRLEPPGLAIQQPAELLASIEHLSDAEVNRLYESLQQGVVS
jgi:acyl transferase domain-containing protein/acyl carrier protein